MFKKEKKEKERDVASERNGSLVEEREMAVQGREKGVEETETRVGIREDIRDRN